MNKLCKYLSILSRLLLLNFNFNFFRMLDDFGNELESTDSKIDATMKKMGKVLQLTNNDRRQWIAILVLSILLFLLIVLFILL